MRHIDSTKIPGVTRLGPFANIAPKELKDWLGKGVIIHITDPRGNTHYTTQFAKVQNLL
jgi:hypothetical protein